MLRQPIELKNKLNIYNQLTYKEIESVKKDFTRQSARLQEGGIVHCYNAEVWIIHEEDRQDI